MFFDSHCHLASSQLAPDFDAILARAKIENVTHFLNIADDFASAILAQTQAEIANARGFSMATTAGIHPQNARNYRFAEENPRTKADMETHESDFEYSKTESDNSDFNNESQYSSKLETENSESRNSERTKFSDSTSSKTKNAIVNPKIEYSIPAQEIKSASAKTANADSANFDAKNHELRQLSESQNATNSAKEHSKIEYSNAAEFASSDDELRELLKAKNVVAVGEIGLDYFYDEMYPQYPGAPRELQQRVFRAQIEIALEHDLPVVIHNREADEDLLRIVGDYPKLRGVFHCFGSSIAVAERVLDFGFYLGFGGILTFKNAQNIRDVAQICPLDRILIETDAPYLAPVPFRGKTNEPSFVPLVAQKLAELRQISIEEIGAITTRNTRTLFHIA